MGRLIKPKIDRIFATKVVQLTQDLSLRSKCIIVTDSNNPCPNCIFDVSLKASSGKYRVGGPTPFTGRTCPVCNSAGKIPTHSQLQIPANIRWGAKKPEPDMPQPEGFVPLGFVRMKAEIKYYDLIYNATYFLIDGVRCSHYDRELKRRGLQSYVICECLVKVDK